MAHIIKGSILTDLRGKLAGTTFQSGVHGLSLRNSRQRKKSVTGTERAQLNFFGVLADAWKGLSLTEKQTWGWWCVWSNQHSKHNPAQIISGLSGFIKVNLPRIKCGIAIMTNAPLTYSVPIYSNVSLKLTFSGFLYLDSNVIIPVNNFVVVKVSQSKAPGINITKNECKAIVKLFTGGTQWDIQAEYVSIFGNAPIAGELIGLCYSQIDMVSGIRLPETFIVCSL